MPSKPPPSKRPWLTGSASRPQQRITATPPPKTGKLASGRDDNKETYNAYEWKNTSIKYRNKNPYCVRCLEKGVFTDCRPLKRGEIRELKQQRQGTLIRRAIGQVDHIIPISEGGSIYDEQNLQTLCLSCHNKKTEEDAKRIGQ